MVLVHTMPTTSLPDLPYELLLAIIEDLDQASLRRLSTLCYRLREVTQPIVTRRDLQNLVDAGSLSLDQDITIERLFRDDEKSPALNLNLVLWYSPRLSGDLQAFRELLSRIDNIASVDITFSRRNLSEHSYSPLSNKSSLGWMHLVAEILNLATSKAQAKVIVQGGIHWPSLGSPFESDFEYQSLWLEPGLPPTTIPPTPSPRTPAHQSFHHISKSFRGFVAKLRISTGLDDPSRPLVKITPAQPPPGLVQIPGLKKNNILLSTPFPCSFLEEFRIHSPILLELPFFPWTLAILNGSPIRTLSISDMHLARHEWEYVLPSITIPTLSCVSLGSSNIAFADLQAFLFRHPSITRLEVSKGDAIGDLDLPTSGELPPNLTDLVAYPECLARLLGLPSSFSSLTSITLISDYRKSSAPFDFLHFETVFKRIAQHTGELSLTLRLFRQRGLDEWLQSIPPKISLRLLRKVRAVVKLEIWYTQYRRMTGTPASVMRLLGLFPSLRHLNGVWGAEVTDSLWDRYPELETINGVPRP
ncbi:hypothetical protein FPV67DRAFT_160675 [Lyophyllum atratum]|nr:hypothetical protein FPV67DRAFT_160675 [Lyophyllum atratum]